MTAEEVAYFDRLFGQRGSAERLDPRAVVYRDGSSPKPARCHENVDRWVDEHPDCAAVRGWLIETETADHATFVAHSAVNAGRGPLVEITLPSAIRFLRHEGPCELWERIEPTNRQRSWPPCEIDWRDAAPVEQAWHATRQI